MFALTEITGGPWTFKPLVIIIALLTVRFGLCLFIRESGKLRIAIILTTV